MTRRTPDQTLIPGLMVLPDEPYSREAMELLESLGVEFETFEMSPDEYESPRDIPKLMVDSGMYIGIDSIQRIAENELIGKT